MQTCISRHHTSKLTLVGTYVGSKVAKAVLMSAATGKLTPEIVGEALMSSSTIRGHVQREAVRLLVVRISMRAPQQLQWLLNLIGDCAGSLSATDALSSLAKRSLFYQVTSFGLHGSAASAITTAALQIGMTTCTLLTSNAALWRDQDNRMSLRQYRYELLTSLYTSVGTVAGGAAGAAAGSMIMPGIGTAFGSVLCSVGGGYVPGYLRDKKGPDDRRRQQATALRRFTPLRMHDTPDGAVFMSMEQLAETPPIAPASAATQVSEAPKTLQELQNTGDTGAREGGAAKATKVDSENGDAEVGDEPVWLDFVRTETPATISLTESSADTKASVDGEDGSQAPLMRSCLRFSPSLAVLSKKGSFHCDCSSGMQSGGTSFQEADAVSADAATITSLSSAPSSFCDAVDAETATTAAERFEGRAKCVTASTAEELQRELEKCGGDSDVLFLFA
ncbi:conserved hypothetical protein [Leishmania major strain Friedlin]|uniref:Uncharacterized protein n=1 Tax=Leishmania major TaxID=5664 RepID=E9ADP8_LEIMA|nr:conserved hypothetical protein [Leishmania major strain Friedlin]CAG9577775.1 hypothetical_protein_-_conserved [Leishmania major strain Friedlin]CBZ12377.1 conserved hypothetical protein [Leishmania major strain Friedlin]|eukprot:XP_003722120.1 conserved hypothetical protein [Leishmania major strain Friedlin]